MQTKKEVFEGDISPGVRVQISAAHESPVYLGAISHHAGL